VIATGEHGTAFEWRTRLAVHAILPRYDDLRSAGRGLDVATFDDPLDVEIVAPGFVDESTAAAQFGRCVDDGGERLEIDRDRIGDVFRGVARRRDAGGDCLADIAHLVGRERRPRRRFGARGARHDADRLHPWQIRCREDVPSRLGRHRNRSYPGMRMWAAQEDHLLGAGEPDVRHELAPPAEVSVILPAQ
jgi:hypothetical protein